MHSKKIVFATLAAIIFAPLNAMAQVADVEIVNTAQRLTGASGVASSLDMQIDIPLPSTCSGSTSGEVFVSTNTNRVTLDQLELLYAAAGSAVATGAATTFTGASAFRVVGANCIAYLNNVNNPGFAPHMSVKFGDRTLEVTLAP